MDAEYSIYLGQEQKNGFTGFLAEKNFFCVVEIFDGYTNEQGEQLMSALAEVGTTSYGTLTEFDSAISALCTRFNTPLDTSISIGYKKNQTFYLKTIGSGEVYIGRGKSLERVIHGALTAAGKYERNDFYIFTTSFFTQSLKGIIHTKPLFHKKVSIRDFPEHIKQTIGAEDDTGAVALFVKMTEHQEVYTSKEPSVGIGEKIAGRIKTAMQTMSSLEKRKKVTIGVVLTTCILLFGWSMTKGIQNRGGVQIGSGGSFEEKKVQIGKLVEQASAKGDSINEGLQLLKDAQGTLVLLTKTSPKDKQQEMTAMKQTIKDAESKLIKRTFKESQEYYTFAFEEKNASGTKLSVFEDKAYVLNPEGKVYVLTLEKKSLLKVTLPKKVNVNSLVGGYDKNTYVLSPEEGIIRVDNLGKSKTIISKETQWSSISSMQIYNGNIYLLDGGNNALYKYPVIVDGYGDRTSYFKGSYADMDTQSTFAIDMSVYVATKDIVTKYTAGLKDDFKLTIPGDTTTITKIITHIDQTDLYLWDKKNGVIYISSRDGMYKGQISSPQLFQATDVEVYNNKAFLLKGAQLLSIDL